MLFAVLACVPRLRSRDWKSRHRICIALAILVEAKAPPAARFRRFVVYSDVRYVVAVGHIIGV